MNNENFVGDLEIKRFVDGCQKILDAYMDQNFPNNPRGLLTFKLGPRYAKVIVTENVNGQICHQSVHSFVDLRSGDVLKPAGWSKPAKHARGNLYDDQHGLGSMGPHGPAYLR